VRGKYVIALVFFANQYWLQALWQDRSVSTFGCRLTADYADIADKK
jgi:hypothetical protein